jgi:hypothetical protein
MNKIIFAIFIYLFCNVYCMQRTTKAKDLLSFQGFELRKKELIAEGQTQVWVCVLKTCNARYHSPVGTVDVVERRAHNHLPNADKNIVIF